MWSVRRTVISIGHFAIVVQISSFCWIVLPLRGSNDSKHKFIFFPKSHPRVYCQRGNRAKKRGWLGGRIITPRNVGKISQILRNLLNFSFLTIFGCKWDPIFGYWRHGLVFTTRGSRLGDSVCSCSLSVQEDLTGEQALIAPAGFLPRGRNPRRHPNVLRVK